MPSINLRLRVLIIIVMFLWAICFPLIVIGLPHAPHVTFATLRALLAGVLLLTIAVIMKRPQPNTLMDWFLISCIGLGATTLGFFGMFHASEFVSPGIATVIANTQPLMAAMLTGLFLKERLNQRGITGLALAFSGVLIIALPSLISETESSYNIGIFYIILSALGITVSNILIRRAASHIDALSAMGWQLTIGSLFLAMISLLTEDISTITWNGAFIVSLLGLALPGTALAYWLWCHVLEDIELNQANAFSFLVPIFGLVLGFLFFDEEISKSTTISISVIILGIVLVNWPKSKSDTPLSAEKTNQDNK